MLSQTLFHTDDVPAGDRVDAWKQCLARTVGPMDVRVTADLPTVPSRSTFSAHQRLLRLDALSVLPMTADACRYVRTPRMIRRSDPEQYHLMLLLPTCGPTRTEHAGHREVHRPRGLYLIDTSLPVAIANSDADAPADAISVAIPRRLLPSPRPDALSSVLGRSLSGESGFGLLLAQFLTKLVADHASYRPADAARLSTILFDLVSGVIARETESEADLPVDVRSRNLELRIRSHIHSHLHDPDLTVGSVAAAHHLSTRQLHRIFQHGDSTVGGYIRAQRLERARSLLADPRHSTTPVHRVAGLCGFNSLAHFSRLFRAAYGATPTEYRRENLGPVPSL